MFSVPSGHYYSLMKKIPIVSIFCKVIFIAKSFENEKSFNSFTNRKTANNSFYSFLENIFNLRKILLNILCNQMRLRQIMPNWANAILCIAGNFWKVFELTKKKYFLTSFYFKKYQKNEATQRKLCNTSKFNTQTNVTLLSSSLFVTFQQFLTLFFATPLC